MFFDFHTSFSKLRHLDWASIFFQLVLLTIGLVFIYGTGARLGGGYATKWLKQLLWIMGGVVIFLFCTLIDYRKLGEQSWILYVLELILLVWVLTSGKTINGAQSWIRIGGLTIQPSEFAKPATLLFMSWAVTHPGWRNSVIPPWLLTGLILAPPLLLVLLQPDMGTVLSFLPFSFCIAFIKGLRWRWIILTLVIGIVCAPILFTHLKPHQQDRIKVFLEAPSTSLIAAATPFVSPEQAKKWNEAHEIFFKSKKIDTWNAEQSLLSVGSGGLTGKGFMKGTQYLLGYLPRPVSPTDFIFSVIAEESGFVGSGFVILMIVCVILCSCRTAILAADEMGMCLALGTAAILSTHAFVNIAMTIQAAPIIGIPLPFISYGGSFMFSTLALTGLCQSVHIRRHEHTLYS